MLRDCWHHRHATLFSAMAAVILSLLAVSCGSSTAGAIIVLKANTDVGPVMQQYIDRGISRAERDHAKLVVIELDTPGGLDTSMRAIVQRIERSKVPIVVYVYPAGARAASAGTFITMAANVAVMAPNTSTGAASPINADGSNITGTLGTKVTNDAVSFIRGIAALRGRNADWAEQAVRNAISADQSVAVSQNVVNFEADSLSALLQRLNGTSVNMAPGPPVTLTGLTSATIIRTNMTPWERFLNFLADPTLASILIALGFFGLVFELASPGLVFPGVFGAIALILGFVGFGTLPVNSAGLVLIAVALICFAIEIHHPSGFLGVGGAVALVLGAIITFRGTPASAQPSLPVVAVVILVATGFVTTIGASVARTRRIVATTGTRALIGVTAVARTAITAETEGFVFVRGERWKALLDSGSATAGDRVRIVGAEGFRLRVHKEEES